jgi:hypothetical protein
MSSIQFAHQDGFVRVENTARFEHASVEHPWSMLELMAHCRPHDSVSQRTQVLSAQGLGGAADGRRLELFGSSFAHELIGLLQLTPPRK